MADITVLVTSPGTPTTWGYDAFGNYSYGEISGLSLNSGTTQIEISVDQLLSSNLLNTTVNSVTLRIDNEVSNTGQYTAGGGVLASQQVSLDGSVAIVDFNDLSFTGVTLSALGAVIYNTSFGNNAAVCVLDFGAVKTATSGTFTILFPAFTSSAAILRIA